MFGTAVNIKNWYSDIMMCASPDMRQRLHKPLCEAKQMCYTMWRLEANNLTDVPYAKDLAHGMTKVINWLID